jgi:hypothetical protein
MKQNLPLVCVLSVLWAIAGCEVPPPNTPASPKSPFDGLKLSDLEDSTQNQVPDNFLMRFRVLTYTLDPVKVDKLSSIFKRLSQSDVRMVNKGAFAANGFAVGTASFETGAAVAQELAQIGAVRTGQASLMIPPDKTDPLSGFPLQGMETIHYTESKGNSATMTPPGPGLLGWVMSAKPDPRFRGLAQVKLFPAYWQPGIEDIRLRMGMEPVEYNPIVVGQVLMRVEEKGIIVLGPTREMQDEMTLDKMLFFLPGAKPKIRFFVIISDSAGV